MDFCALTEKLWKLYFLGDGDETDAAARQLLDENCMVFGTGKDEVYYSREEMMQAIREVVKQRENIPFEFKDFHCFSRMLGPDACAVYGGVSIWWESEDRKILIDMESRFTMLYQQMEDGWKVVHIHQSVPNREQLPGEYYPKTLAEQTRRAWQIAVQMQDLAQRDGLTELINYRGLVERWRSWKKENSWVFILDLDNFKRINDTYGHLAGNRILKSVAEALWAAVRDGDVVCRAGGDEFVLLCGGIPNEEMAHKAARHILRALEEKGKSVPEWVGISAGGTAVREEDSVEQALDRADQALYQVKKSGKHNYLFA